LIQINDSHIVRSTLFTKICESLMALAQETATLDRLRARDIGYLAGSSTFHARLACQWLKRSADA